MKKFTILIPVYNDWTSAFILLKNIDVQVANWDAEVSVLIINDASSEARKRITFATSSASPSLRKGCLRLSFLWRSGFSDKPAVRGV